jgi:uncharacterized protein (TIGR02466 family)
MAEAYFYFASPIYVSDHPEYLPVVSEVSEEMLSKITDDPHEIYPMVNTENFALDSRLEDFCRFLAEQGHSILKAQGYAMEDFGVSVDALWAQKHYKHSLMEQHVHGGSQLIGFYFLETPENCSRPLFHDPRPAKMQNYLTETNMSEVTLASGIVNFEPQPGKLIISNAWLPHSFGRHGSDEPLKFVHFNLGAFYAPHFPQNNTPTAEIV